MVLFGVDFVCWCGVGSVEWLFDIDLLFGVWIFLLLVILLFFGVIVVMVDGNVIDVFLCGIV